MRLGRQHEPIRVEELSDDAKPPILREYLRRCPAHRGSPPGVPNLARSLGKSMKELGKESGRRLPWN